MLRPKSTGGGVAMLSGSGASPWERYSWPKYCHRVHQAALSRTTATPGSPTSSAYVFRRVNAIRSAAVDPVDVWPVNELAQSQAAAVKGQSTCVLAMLTNPTLLSSQAGKGGKNVEAPPAPPRPPQPRKQGPRGGPAEPGG